MGVAFGDLNSRLLPQFYEVLGLSAPAYTLPICTHEKLITNYLHLSVPV